MKKKLDMVEEIGEKRKLPVEGVTEALVGEMVHYHKEIETGMGRKIETFAAIILRPADKAAGNFQAKDGAADLKVFTSHKGGGDENKFSVLWSESKGPNRWTFR
jgi:hypothetical protein